jgi:tetratricopeptide (TPR) repeat protein
MGDQDDRRMRLQAVAELTALYQRAFQKGDLAKAEQLSAMMRAFSDGSPVNQEMAKVGQGERLILGERWAEARDVLASIDRSILPETSRPGVLNNLAYSTALAGDPSRAIELIVEALKHAESITGYPSEKLPFMRATHGIALSLAAKHEEAIALLEPVVAIPAPPRARTARAYFLAQSYRALGRTADATRSFELAATGGEGPFAKPAAEALAQLAQQR